MIRSKRRRHGSLSLEAAIVMPMTMLLLAGLIMVLLGIEADIKVKGSLDRTASELSLLGPAAGLAESLDLFGGTASAGSAGSISDDDISEYAATLNNIFEDSTLKELTGDLMLDISTTAVLGNLVQKRLDYWLGEAWSGQPGWFSVLGHRSLYLDWQISKNRLWLCLSYDLFTPFGPVTRHALSVVPLWIGAGQETSAQEEEIWLLDNFSRGKKFREIYGANLPGDFPVIASFQDGEAIMIKSIDLTAPSYHSLDAAAEEIMAMIDKLAAFQGASVSRQGRLFVISPEQIDSRRLLVIIPSNSPENGLSDQLSDLEAYANACQCIFQVVRHGVSTRYQSGAA